MKVSHECDEMPHTESIKMMEFMDALRKEWGIKFQFDNVLYYIVGSV